MPCKLPEDLSSVTDDVFSYMCNLAMEKCSKKSEKKKASCGGAAMRKRLLIKNFVAQMLAQERQRTYANSSYCKDDYDDCASDDRSDQLAPYSSVKATASTDVEMSEANTGDDEECEEDEEEEESVDDEEEEDDEDVPVADEEDVEDEEDCDEDEEIDTHNLARYELNCPPTGSMTQMASPSGYSPDDEADEEEEDDDEEEREMARHSTVRSSISPSSAPVELFLAPPVYPEMISYSCVEPAGPISAVASMADSLMYLSPCTSASVCSTSELMFCDSTTSAAVYSASSLYDPSAGSLLGSYCGSAAAPMTASAYSPPAGSASPPSSAAPLDGAYAATTAAVASPCPVMHSSAGTEWDEFHTVPLTRDYMMEESICPPETYYSLYPTAYASPVLPAGGAGYGMIKPPEQKPSSASTQCQEFDDFSNAAPLTGVVEPLKIGEPLPENFLEDSATVKSDANNNSDASELCFWTSYDQQKPQPQRPITECDGNGDASPAEPPRAGSPLHTLVTMVPPMLKLGSCRSEFTQSSAVMAASYRRCITDLDTNMVVEEEYGSGCHRLLDVNRKRPSSPYELFGADRSATGDEIDAADVVGDVSDGASGGASSRAFCNIFMLTTSPKRLRL